MTHTLLLVVITATLSSITTMYAPTLVTRLKRLKPRLKVNKHKWGKHQLTVDQILEQIEKRIELLNNQNSSFHNRMDKLEESKYVTTGELSSLIDQVNGALQNIDVKADEAIQYAKKRDSDRTAKTKKIVVDYLNELKK